MEVFKNKSFLVAVFCLFVIIVSSMNKRQKTHPVQWTKVQENDLLIKVTETGEVESFQTVEIKSPAVNLSELQIINIIPEGSIVDSGAFIIQFDATNFYPDLEQAREDLSAAEIEKDELLSSQAIKKIELQSSLEKIELSMEDNELQKQLLKFQAKSKQEEAELEYKKNVLQQNQARTALSSQEIIDQAKLKKVDLKIDNMKQRIRQIENQISQLTLFAPKKGLVVYNEIGRDQLKRKVSIGDKLSPGQVVLQIPNLDSLQIKLGLNQIDIFDIHENSKALITFDAYPEIHFTGHVKKIGYLINDQSEKSQMENVFAAIAIDHPDTLMKPGMTAKVDILLEQFPNVKQIPVGAVYELNGNPVIFPKKSYPDPLPISIACRSDIYLGILSDKIKTGDRVAINPPNGDEYRKIGFSKYRGEDIADFDSVFTEMEKLGFNYDYETARNNPKEEFDSTRLPMQMPQSHHADLESQLLIEQFKARVQSQNP